MRGSCDPEPLCWACMPGALAARCAALSRRPALAPGERCRAARFSLCAASFRCSLTDAVFSVAGAHARARHIGCVGVLHARKRRFAARIWHILQSCVLVLDADKAPRIGVMANAPLARGRVSCPRQPGELLCDGYRPLECRPCLAFVCAAAAHPRSMATPARHVPFRTLLPCSHMSAGSCRLPSAAAHRRWCVEWSCVRFEPGFRLVWRRHDVKTPTGRWWRAVG